MVLLLTVHPRVCGEHRKLQGELVVLNGSSPRVRGTRICPPPRCFPQGFIPACAGNTCGRLKPNACKPVHPRVCGEHKTQPATAATGTGSSPRVRGTPTVKSVLRIHRRFIPACAGNTTVIRPLACLSPVHPRVCGEHMPAVTPSI